MKEIMALAKSISELTGANVDVDVSCGDFLIGVYGCRSSYSVVCDNEDDCYNTLDAMLNGIRLFIEMKGRDNA